MKVLSIGNSFSQDAQRYLHEIAKKEGVDMKTVNLYIGGCPLRTHYLNMLEDKEAYAFEFNGQKTGLEVTMSQVLKSDDWDVITLQQLSGKSGRIETYTPYIEELRDYAKTYCPHAKIYLHETWAYEDGSERMKGMSYGTAENMYNALHDAYLKAKDLIDADKIIPAGTAMIRAEKAGLKMHRDTCHASHGVGRYLIALTWFRALTGKDITENTFSDLDEAITEEERKIVIDAVNSCF